MISFKITEGYFLKSLINFLEQKINFPAQFVTTIHHIQIPSTVAMKHFIYKTKLQKYYAIVVLLLIFVLIYA